MLPKPFGFYPLVMSSCLTPRSSWICFEYVLQKWDFPFQIVEFMRIFRGGRKREMLFRTLVIDRRHFQSAVSFICYKVQCSSMGKKYHQTWNSINENASEYRISPEKYWTHNIFLTVFFCVHLQGGMHLFQTNFWQFCSGEVNTPVATCLPPLGEMYLDFFPH